MKNIIRPDYGVIADRHKLVIGVAGIGRGAGATFIAMGLALKMAEMTAGVTFLEGKAHQEESRSPYRILASDRGFKEKHFIDFFKEEGGRPGLRTNLYNKVNWVVRGLAAPEAPGAAQAAPDCRLLPGSCIIIDNPVSYEDLDLIVCVADPLPSRIMAGLETFRRIREQAIVPVIWLLNKNCPPVSRRQVETFLKTRFTHVMPLIPAEVFYRAEYDCNLPYAGSLPEDADAVFKRLAEEILLHN